MELILINTKPVIWKTIRLSLIEPDRKHCGDMKINFIAIMAGIIALMTFVPQTAAPQPAPAVPADTALTAEQLDQLVAPIALYPDPLVAQILMAATYPLEIVETDRWLQTPANTTLKGDTLTAALQQQPWDPSVKSLVSFPPLLHMMNSNLGWTEQLGDAFLAQQADVMDAVQRLRQRAKAAGSLVSTPQQTIATQDQEIAIEQVSPEIIYIPAYNPWCVYGPWPYPAYPPFYFGSWSGYCGPADALLAFDVGIYPPFGFWAWGSFDWRHHQVRIDHNRFQRFRNSHEPPGGVWQHDPTHRHGVPYRDPATAARFQAPAAAARRDFRGFTSAPAPAAAPKAGSAARSLKGAPATVGRPSATPSAPQRRAPPAFESFGPGARVRGEATRGSSSRMAPAPSFRAAPAPSFHAAPAPSFHAAPAPSSHGGGGGGGGGHRR